MKLELWLKAKDVTIFIDFFLSKKLSSKKVMEHLLCEPTVGGECNVCGMNK